MKRLIRYWKITPGQNGFLWREQKLNECVAVGWSDIGNISGISKEKLRGKKHKGKPLKRLAVNQLNDFVNEVQIGDKVIASASGKGIYAVGTVTGDYRFDKELEYKHSRKVQWETTFWHPVKIKLLKLPNSLYNKFHGLSSKTIRELNQDEWDKFCDQLNKISTPFRNLGMWGGMIQSPEYENEVMILFNHMLQHFNMRIIQFGTRFPDAIVERKRGNKWEKLNVEFELHSRGFQSHLSDCDKRHCDLIVCWKDDWHHLRRREFEIIELKKQLEKIL